MPVSQEVYFAHHLAANEKVTRDRALRKLTRWIRAKSGDENTEFTEESLMKLWKGLFFCMWMSDKPFIQQELASSIAGLVHCFANRTQSLLYLDTFFKTMAREWFAIDRFRLEKFMMLVRRCFRQGILCARGTAWEDEGIVDFCNMLKTTALCPNSQGIPLGLRLHVADVFIQELARMHGAELSPEQALLFLEPFFDILTQSNEHTLVDVVRKNVFFLAIDLDREAAELGVDPSRVQLNGGREDEEEEEDEYDQHGRVLEKGEASQDLAAIPFDYSMIADKLFDALKSSTLKPFNRTVITRMVKKYRAILKEGLVRQPVKDVYVGRAITDDDIEAAANRLEEELEEELEEDREEVDKLKKGRKKTKPSFGFDSASGAYEYLCDDSDSQASGDEADCGTTAKQPRKKLGRRNLQKEVEDTPDELGLSSEEDSAVAEAKPSTLGRKRKRPAKLKRGAVDSAEESFDAAGEASKVPKKRTRRKKREAGHRKLADTSQTKQERNVGKIRNGLNGLDEDAGVAEKVVHQKPQSPVIKPLVVEGKSLLAKKAGPLVLGKAPRKKSLAKKPSGTVQQQLVRPSSNEGCPSEGPQEHKVGLLKRRAEAQGKKKRRLSATNWKVTPVSTEETEPARTVATPFITAQTSCGDAAVKLPASPNTQPLRTGTPASTAVAKGKTAGDAAGSCGGPRESEKVGLGTKAVSAKPPSPPVPDAKSPGIKTPRASLPCTPQLSRAAGTLFGKCLTAAKAGPSKPVMFLTPPAKPLTPSQDEKKVVFALSRNSAQHPREYFETLKNSPQIPFDASKKPAQGVLKARLSLASNTTSPARPKKRSRASDFF